MGYAYHNFTTTLGISNVKKEVQQRTLNNSLYLHTEITLHFTQLHQYLSRADRRNVSYKRTS